jgi:hypothetical protein
VYSPRWSCLESRFVSHRDCGEPEGRLGWPNAARVWISPVLVPAAFPRLARLAQPILCHFCYPNYYRVRTLAPNTNEFRPLFAPRSTSYSVTLSTSSFARRILLMRRVMTHEIRPADSNYLHYDKRPMSSNSSFRILHWTQEPHAFVCEFATLHHIPMLRCSIASFLGHIPRIAENIGIV